MRAPLPTASFLILVFAAAAAAAASPASGDAWPFPDKLRSRLVFVHPLVNYALHPTWQRRWERGLHRGNGIQANVGSVSTDDLLTEVTVHISEPVADGVRFLYRADWWEGLHRDRERRRQWLGFEVRLKAPLAARLLVHPAGDKEEFDLRAGVLIADRSRERYLRLDLWFEDFMFGAKNDRGGESERETVGVWWEMRHQSGHWEVFSEGRRGTGMRRVFPDAVLSPQVSAAALRDDTACARVRRLLDGDGFVGLEATHYRFDSEERRRDAVAGFDYHNEFVHLRGIAYFGIADAWSLRPEMHWLRQWTRASGRRDFRHRRTDVFPALFCEHRAGPRSTWELGYMATRYRWDHSVGSRILDDSGSTDKLKLGWLYAFAPTATVQLSLSHELDLARFGGGNVQLQMEF